MGRTVTVVPPAQQGVGHALRSVFGARGGAGTQPFDDLIRELDRY